MCNKRFMNMFCTMDSFQVHPSIVDMIIKSYNIDVTSLYCLLNPKVKYASLISRPGVQYLTRYVQSNILQFLDWLSRFPEHHTPWSANPPKRWLSLEGTSILKVKKNLTNWNFTFISRTFNQMKIILDTKQNLLTLKDIRFNLFIYLFNF